MSNPTVLAVMLVNGRHDMVLRARQCFSEQTYENKRLFTYDTGSPAFCVAQSDGLYQHYPDKAGYSIGFLRNCANRYACKDFLDAQIIVHWDSDDWSHPRRIEEQVALLQASGKQCVGYREMLFWRYDPRVFGYAAEDAVKTDEGYTLTVKMQQGEAWLYTNTSRKYCLGTSLCYWRKAWEDRPFPDAPKVAGESGEDTLWLREINSVGYPSILYMTPDGYPEPRMVASVHGGNTSTQYQDIIGMQSSPSWRRAPEWDNFCNEAMAL